MFVRTICCRKSNGIREHFFLSKSHFPPYVYIAYLVKLQATRSSLMLASTHSMFNILMIDLIDSQSSILKEQVKFRESLIQYKIFWHPLKFFLSHSFGIFSNVILHFLIGKITHCGKVISETCRLFGRLEYSEFHYISGDMPWFFFNWGKLLP